MRLNPAQLPAHLAKGLLPIYVVSGDEPLLVEESLDLIRACARRNGFSERDVFDVERGFNWGHVIEACASLSLFATRRIVEVRMPKGPGAARGRAAAEDVEDEDDGAAGRSSMDGAKILVELAQRPSPDTLLIAACGALDYKQRQAQWYQALESAGASVHAEDIKPEAWADWIEGRLRAAGLRADPEAVRTLAERTEGNALAAKQDIEKLKLLYPDGTLDGQAVRDVVADSARYGAFDLAERMLSGDVAGAGRAVAHLRAEGAEPVQVLAALTWTIRQWAQVQARVDGGAEPEQACGAFFIPRARVPMFVRALRRTPRAAAVYGWLRQAATVDQLSKSTGGKDQAWEELLTLVLAAAGRRVMRPQAVSAS